MKRRKPMKRGSGLRASSERSDARARARTEVKLQLALKHPYCQRCKTRPSVDAHEPGRRSRGADPTNPDHIVLLCRECHEWVESHPEQATADGWMIPSWNPDKSSRRDA